MPDRAIDWAISLGWLVGGAVLIVLYYLFFPDQAQKALGGLASLIGRIYKRADKTAVALRVQGTINEARSALLKDAPPGVMDKKLKIKWADVENAQAALRDGEVVVLMRPSNHQAENVATALMTYLPKAVIPRARPYVSPVTMQATDLILAKSVLSHHDDAEATLNVFFERHFDAARDGNDELKAEIERIDRIDLHGWLSRILLAEYKRLGDQLHPGAPDEHCLKEAEQLAGWLSALAQREPGRLGSLRFEGRYLRVAVIFVADRHVLEEKGTDPYRKRAKRHIYSDRFDSVYLLARDQNISAVDEVVASLESDALIQCGERYEYNLRADFKARILNRDRGICVCLRRKAGAALVADDEPDSGENALPDETFDFPVVEGEADAAP